jgi:hypothetical protein
MARPVKLPPNVAKLIKEIKNLEYSLDKRDKLGWSGVERSNLPDASMDRVIDKFEKLKKWEKNGIITGPQYKKAVEQLEGIMPSLQRRVAKMGVVDGDMFRLPEPAPSSTVARPNAYYDPAKAGPQPVRTPPGLIGASMPETPRPAIPPKVPGMPGTAGTGDPINLKQSLLADNYTGGPSELAKDAGRVGSLSQGAPGGGVRKAARLAANPRPEPEGMGPWKPTGRTEIPDRLPEPGIPERTKPVAGQHMMRLREGLKDFDLAKAGKIGGKVAKGGLLGLPLLALDYMAPGNAIASSSKEGYGMLDDMGMDIQGGIDSIENPWARGGASLLDGLLVDPAMTALGGAKKFREMIVRDAKAAAKRRKDRKKSNWKPKLYRGGPRANGT